MKNIFHSLSLEDIKKEVTDVAQRFQFSCVIVIIVSLLFLFLLHGNTSATLENNITRSIFSFIVVFFLSSSIYIWSESEKHSVTIKQLWQILPLIFGGLFFWKFNPNANDFESIVLFLVSLFGIIAFLFFAPYLRNLYGKETNNTLYYSYFYQVSTVFLWSVILGGLLFSLGAIAVATVTTLFDISWSYVDKLYGDWAIFALSFVTPLFALTKLPSPEEFGKNTFKENLFFSFLIKYVAISFILVYFLILYAYSMKVLFNFGDWPKGEICWMVIGFSIFGYITYIFSYTFEEKIGLIKTFRKYFPYAVIPQTFMLFYAIYLRIAQYDITINRYFVVVFGIWLLSISTYFIFSKQKYLGFIPAIITLFTIIVSLGPWSVYSFPESRQLSRLENNLTEANILQNGVIIPLDTYEIIDPKLSGNIYSGIEYLCTLSNCKTIKDLFPTLYNDLVIKNKQEFEKQQQSDIQYYAGDTDMLQSIREREYSQPRSWEITSYLTTTLKVREYYGTESVYQPDFYNFYTKYDDRVFPIDLEGYSKIARIQSRGGVTEGLSGEYNTRKSVVILKEGTSIIEEYDISPLLKKLVENYNGENGGAEVKSSDMILEVVGERYTVKIFLENVSAVNPNKEKIGNSSYLGDGAGYILIK